MICQTRAAKRSRRIRAAFRAPSAGMAGHAASFPMFASMRAAGAFSKDRAQSVALYLATLEVKSARFSIAGCGETQPIMTNDTLEGRQKNRRVDIAVLANDKLNHLII